MKKILLVLFVVFTISSCATVTEDGSNSFGKENISSVVLARTYSQGDGAGGVGTEFDLNGKIIAVFAIKSDALNKFNNYHTTRIEYYQNDQLVLKKDNYQFNMKESPWYVWMPTYAISLGEGEFVAKFYIDNNLIESKSFTITE